MTSRARTIVAFAIALFALLALLARFVLIELFLRRTAIPIACAIAVALACVAAGALARRTRVADPVLDLVLGLPLFGTLCFLIGTLHVSAWTMAPLVAIGALAGVWFCVTRALQPPQERQEWRSPMFMIPVAIVLACAFVAAQAPPSSLDELSYHLAVPRTWANEGRAVELPLISHSYFPLGIESASLPLLATLSALDAGIASHFLHLFAAIATGALILRRTRSWLATAAIVTTPALAIIAGWSLVDVTLAGICVALAVALEDGDDATATAATAAGILTKYTFLPFALLAFAAKRKWRPAIAGVAIGSVFLIRNLILAGNPIAPFLTIDASHFSGYRADARLPDYIFGERFVDESIGASLIALATGATGALPLVLLAGAIALLLLAPSSRILVPFLVVPAMSGAALLRKRAFAIIVAIAVVIQTLLVGWLTDRNGYFSLLSGTASDTEYLVKVRPSVASIVWIDASLPPQSRTLVVGLNETYWFAHRVRGGGNFDGVRVSRYLETPTPEALRERLRRDGITHVAVISAPVRTREQRKLEERQTSLTPAAQRMLAMLLDRYASSVTSRGDAALFALR